MQYKITQDKQTIQAIQSALDECIMGKGFSIMCDIEHIDNGNDATLIFKTKDETKELNFNEILTFGIMIGTDFIPKTDCKVCKNLNESVNYNYRPLNTRK